MLAIQDWRARGWPQATATLEKCEVISAGHGDYMLALKYRYEFAGRTAESELLALQPRTSAQAEEMRRLKAQFEGAQPLICYVEPGVAEPRAILQRPGFFNTGFAVGVLLIALGLTKLTLVAARARATPGDAAAAQGSVWAWRFAYLSIGLAGLVCFAFLFGFAAIFIRDVQPYFWPTTPAVLESVRVVERTRDDPPGRFVLRVKYHFDWQGQRIVSNDYTTSPQVAWHHLDLRRLQARIEQASPLRCYVNAGATPPRAILARSPLVPSAQGTVVLIGCMLLTGCFVHWVRRLWRERRPAPPSEPRPIAMPVGVPKLAKTGAQVEAAATRLGTGIVLALVLAWGLTALYQIEIRPRREAARAKAWPEVPCTIIWSLPSVSTTRTATRMPDIFFRYTYQGKRYEASGVRPGDMPSWSKAMVDDFTQRFSKGARTTCFVNPREPYEALLVREPIIPAIDRFWYLWILIAAPFVVFLTPRVRKKRGLPH